MTIILKYFLNRLFNLVINVVHINLCFVLNLQFILWYLVNLILHNHLYFLLIIRFILVQYFLLFQRFILVQYFIHIKYYFIFQLKINFNPFLHFHVHFLYYRSYYTHHNWVVISFLNELPFFCFLKFP